jgi:CelD/BcsL family acetyltransferase involved in cellulose biosynthesis
MTDIASLSPSVLEWDAPAVSDRAEWRGVRGARLDAFADAPALAGTRLAIHTSFAECEALWRRAMATGAAYGFQSFEWLSAWQDTIGAAENVRPYLVHLVDRRGRPLMVLPLGIYLDRGLRMLRPLGAVVSDYNAPVIDPEFARAVTADDIARLWTAILKLLPEVDLVWLRRMPETVEGVPNPLVASPGAEPIENGYAASLPADGAAFRAAHASLLRETRKKRKGMRGKGEVAFSVAASADETLAALRALMPQKSRRWRESNNRDLFAEPAYCAFYERISRTPIPDGGAWACSLRAGDTVVATHWGLRFKDRLYCLLLGREEGEWARYSPGSLLIEDMIEQCIADPQLQVFDFTAGEEPFKRRWADQTLRLYEFIAPCTLVGGGFVAAYRAKERLKRHRGLRNFVRRLKGKRPV